MKILTVIASMAISFLAYGQSATTDQHGADVDTRGDHEMGFSHNRSVHHFYLLKNGGEIEVAANDPNDTTSRDEIRMHLAHVARMFSEGDFQIPMFIHDTVPPGVPVMKEKRSKITYVFAPTPNGGRVRIASDDPAAVKAIHEFLAFQIDDHRTGDSKAVASPALN